MNTLHVAGRVSTFGFAVLVAIGIAGSAEAKPGGGSDPTRPVCSTPGVVYPDSDGDFLTDCQETTIYRSNPSVVDTDGDLMGDGAEVLVWHSNPLVYDPDSDGDTAQDPMELTYGWDPNDADMDDDGLVDMADAYQACGGVGGNKGCFRWSYPTDADVDDDGLEDGYEFVVLGTSSIAFDTDGDGIGDGAELSGGRYVTDPLKFDTDFDGVGDGDEIRQGSDPTSAFSF